MTTLLDSTGKLCGYIYNNKILLASTREVAGVILGDCVFGRTGEVKGKLFNKTLYATSGEIVAHESVQQPLPEFDAINELFKAWTIVEKIHDHQCPWVIPQLKRYPKSLDAFLLEPGTATVIKIGKRQLL